MTYLVYGLALESALALPGLDVIAHREPDLHIRLREFEVPDLHQDGPLQFCLDETDWYLRWPGEATFRLGEAVLAVMLEGEAAPAAERILRALLGLFLRRSGRVVLHGNVVSLDGQALCLLGATGAGKTTITRALLDAGWLFLSDDLSVLEERSGAWFAHPGPRRVKVRTPFGGKSVETPLLQGNSARLDKILVLEAGAPVSRQDLRGSDALLALVRHAHMPRSLDIAGHAGDHLHQCGRLAASVAISRLRRGTDLKDLPKAIRLLEGRVTGTSAASAGITGVAP